MVLLGLLAQAWLEMMFGNAIAAPVVVLRKVRRFVFMEINLQQVAENPDRTRALCKPCTRSFYSPMQ